MYVYGQLLKADLENLATAPSSPSRGRVYWDTALGCARGYNGTTWRNLGGVAPVTKTTTYSATDDDDVIIVDGSGSSWTLTLPTAVGRGGKQYTFVRSDTTLNRTVTIDGNGSETIDGATTKILYTPGEMLTIVSDGSNWQIINHKVDTAWTSFTPTSTWSANVTHTGLWRRVGDVMEFQINIAVSGAPTAASLSFNMPTGITIDTAKLINSSATVNNIVGSGVISDAGAAWYPISVSYSGSNQVSAHYWDDSATALAVQAIVSQTAPITFANTDAVVATFRVPVSGWWV